ncbi:hypothetical protein C806_04704 [Lachnospiraceae bacterium 3-1]|nr:hypothetical protein C806_04704 [Lachnospiraceae bacterium 3-1]
MKKVLKIVGIVILGMIILIVLVVGFLLMKNYIDSQKPWLAKDYYTQFQSDSELEKKYAGLGDYEVSVMAVKSKDKSIGNIRIWYPSEMENRYPLIVVVNGSNTAALNYEPYFERLASWGFVVVGNDDRQAGTGISTSLTLDYMLEQNQNSDSLFYEKIDVQNIGIAGYSQGGVGAVRAVTEFENSGLYKTIFTGSAAHSYLAQMWGGYDASKVSIPWFMTAAAGTSDDTGATDAATEWLGIAPLSSLIENYNAMPDNVFKLRARVEGAEHEEMQMKTDGYMTAWMLYQLQGDEEAGKALIGEDAEILSNSNWQDIEKNR